MQVTPRGGAKRQRSAPSAESQSKMMPLQKRNLITHYFPRRVQMKKDEQTPRPGAYDEVIDGPLHEHSWVNASLSSPTTESEMEALARACVQLSVNNRPGTCQGTRQAPASPA